MVTQWFMVFLHGLASALVSFMQATIPSPPSFIADMTNAFNTAYGTVPEAVRFFVPFGPTVAAALVYYGIVLTLGVIRFARRVLSLFTGGGGNA